VSGNLALGFANGSVLGPRIRCGFLRSSPFRDVRGEPVLLRRVGCHPLSLPAICSGDVIEHEEFSIGQVRVAICQQSFDMCRVQTDCK